MKKQHPIFLIVIILLGFQLPTAGQNENVNYYNLGKEFLAKGNYQEAQKIFTDISKNGNEKSEITAYSFYFSSYCYYKSAAYKDANYVLFQLINKYPDWGKIDLAYYLKGVIQFESGNHADGILQFGKIRSKDMQSHRNNAMYSYLDKMSSDSLIILLNKFPDEETIMSIVTRKTTIVTASGYNLALLLPYESSLKSQFVYQFYAGIQLGIDSLKRAGINLTVSTYETGKDSAKVKDFIAMPDANGFDLVIGPLFTSQQPYIAKFANDRSVNVVNPLSNNGTFTVDNPNYYLFKPSYETQGREAARFAIQNFTRKNAVIIYGTDPGDSLMARSYKNTYESNGGRVLIYKSLGKFTAGYFGTVLNKVPKDSLGHIFVASSESSLAANIFAHLEKVLLDKMSAYKDTRSEEERSKDKKEERKLTVADVPILAPQSWLDFQSISYEQFALHRTHFIGPDFISDSIPNISFTNNFINKVGMYPSSFAYTGFDLILYYGKLLQKYGRRFNEFIRQEKFVRGYATPWIGYTNQNDNQFVPILRIEDFKLKLVNRP